MSSTLRERLWPILQTVSAAAICAAFGMALAVYRGGEIREIRVAALERVTAAHGERLTHLERPELLVELASATEAVEKLEAGAEQSEDNARAIAEIKATQEAQTGQLERLEEGQSDTNSTLREILLRLPSDRSSPPPE